MRHLFLKVLLPTGILLLLLSSCFGPVVRKVEDPAKPISRPLYSVLPPSGEGWRYIQDDLPDGGHAINFFKVISPTHSIAANIMEMKAGPPPSTPQKFLEMIENEVNKEASSDSERYKEQSNTFVLSSQFGPYTVRASSQMKDYGAVNRGENPFLTFACYRYYFFHPSQPFILVTVDYSERGKNEEMNKNLEHDAEDFFSHISLTK